MRFDLLYAKGGTAGFITLCAWASDASWLGGAVFGCLFFGLFLLCGGERP